MRLIADLHIHSRFSLATSPKLSPAYLDRWARVKGIDLLGTGDCTHPKWLSELRDQLEPAEEGLFRLAGGVKREFDAGPALAEGIPAPGLREGASDPRFILTGEISTIYSRDGRTRKVHHLVILPDFAAAAAFQSRLERVGNISSDGRPILGLDSRDLFSLLLESDDRSILIPAHVWTPWFSALGSKSGFDSIGECYGDLASRIGAIETGLSSNPPMNWAVGSLDRYSIISNSDAHSPEKLGREATLLDMDLSYSALAQALSGGGPRGTITGTMEFFPQEGKYHYDGHRSCGEVLSPEESAEAGGICPKCGKPLTPGVLRRVCELADRPVDESAPCPADWAGTNRRPYSSLIPLPEILGELLGCGSGSKKTGAAYASLIGRAGSEFALLLDASLPEIASLSAPGIPGELLSLAIGRMRTGEVEVTPGFDGEYGVVRVFAPGTPVPRREEAGLFSGDPVPIPISPAPTAPCSTARSPAKRRRHTERNGGAAASAFSAPVAAGEVPAGAPSSGPLALDSDQERAVNHSGGPALVVAGPGTGKTAVLALRVARLIREGADPASILALTFTNKAAGELRDRLRATVGAEAAASVTASTFHSFCRSLLRRYSAQAGLSSSFRILDEDGRTRLLESVAGSASAARRLGSYAEGRKRFLLLPGDSALRLGPGAPWDLPDIAVRFGAAPIDPALEPRYAAYRDSLRNAAVLDFDDLVAGAARLLAAKSGILAECRARYREIFVDEYQDVNFAQYALVRILAGHGSGVGLCAIGDPDQAIYGFRGSDRRFMDRFGEDFPGAATYRLSRTFRCAAPIIGAAARLVGASFVGSGKAVALSRTEFPSAASEAEGIAREIDRLIGGTRFFAMDSGVVDGRADSLPALRSLGECAVLVRAAALAPPLEKALLDHGIPYRLVGERPWWEESAAGSILARLRDSGPPDGFSDAAAVPSETVRAIAAELGLSGEEDSDRLAGKAALYGDLESFLDDLALGAPQDGIDPRAERVSLMTIHAAKGLEFDHVFVAGLEDGLLPFTLFDDKKTGDDRVEEERRLLYVAMTRARIALRLSWAKGRDFRGRSLSLPPSRFLAELEDLVPLDAAEGPRRERNPQLGLF